MPIATNQANAALPSKGCVVDLTSGIESADDVFDVSLTSNCMGAAVLIYELVETLQPALVDAITDYLGVCALHPFGKDVGLVYLEHPGLGRAVLRYGSREIRLTLLLKARLDQRDWFENALVQAAQPAVRPNSAPSVSKSYVPAEFSH
jgi:hypothetical protein